MNHEAAREYYAQRVWIPGLPAWENADWEVREQCYEMVEDA